MGKGFTLCVALCLFVMFVDVCKCQVGSYGSRRRPTRRCPPLCRNFCPNGRVHDRNGCPTCRCIRDSGVSRVQCPPGSQPVFRPQSCPSFQLGTSRSRRNPCGPSDRYFCQPSPVDGPGRCCRYNRISPPVNGRCPVNRVITTCQITRDHCSNDWECGQGRRCCRYGCGRRCVRTGGVGQY